MRRSRIVAATLSTLALLAGAAAPSSAETPKSGGHLNLMQREDLSQGFAVHETSTIATSFPSMPCFNNLIEFDQTKRAETVENLVGELAEQAASAVAHARDYADEQGRRSYSDDLVRQFTKAGATVLVNLSNDGYFGHSAAR